MPRKAREMSALQIYHVVVKGADRQVMFEETCDYKKYIDILDYYQEECHFELYAYCLMSNHVHLLIHVNEVPLSTIFRRINTTYAGWFNTKYKRTGFLQDGRFYSEPINSLDYLMCAIRYIHFNPYKAGLEKYPGQKYIWNSYNQFFKDTPRLVDSKFVLSLFGSSNNFIDFHDKKPEEDFWDIEKARKHVHDDIAQKIIFELSQCSNSAEFQSLPIRLKKNCIRRIHEKGVSIRQLNRLTGIPRGIIENCLMQRN